MTKRNPYNPQDKGGKKFYPGDPRINRKGRKPMSQDERDFRELCRVKAPAALERIEDIAVNCKEPLVRFKANEYLVDRGYGRPKQAIDVAGDLGKVTIGLPAQEDASIPNHS